MKALMRRLGLVYFALLTAIVARGDDGQNTADIEKLQGTWLFVSQEAEGKKTDERFLKASRLVIKGNSFEVTTPGFKDSGTFTVDAGSKPKKLDLVFTDGPDKGETSLAIYELDGDIYQVCLAFGGKPRPTALASAPGSGSARETLRRETENDRELARLEGEWAMVSGERDGQPLPDHFVKSAKRVSKGDETTVTFGAALFMKSTVTVDISKKPKWIDYDIAGGPYKGTKQAGIYELNGDTLCICFARDRPTDFTTKVGDGRTASTWKRTGK